jgi:uncharacterized membrane protein (GlpM family)
MTGTSDTAVQPDTRAGKLRQAPARDWLIRFAFGAGVSALAAVVAKTAGPVVGGLFLAFPAILLASLTLVAKQEGGHRAREDARGAALGALGLIGFALVVWGTTPRWPVWLTLTAATLAWAAVSGVAYLIVAARQQSR